jgi:hypothetical protein
MPFGACITRWELHRFVDACRSGKFRLYHAVASKASMLAKDGEADHRVAVRHAELPSTVTPTASDDAWAS